MNKVPINVQDSFFYNLRKDNVPVTVRLTSGEDRLGKIGRASCRERVYVLV